QASALMLIPAARGRENEVAELTAGGSLSWSADGQWIIATDGPPKAKSIVAISAATGAKHVLTKPSDFGYLGAELSPDSRRLIFGRSIPQGGEPLSLRLSGLGDDVLQNVEDLATAGFPINEF